MATFTNKSELISSMRSGNNLDWDIIIIGGGITGAGILREAVRRGYKSLLIEKMLTKSMDLTSIKEVRQKVATSEFYEYPTTTSKHVVALITMSQAESVRFV